MKRFSYLRRWLFLGAIAACICASAELAAAQERLGLPRHEPSLPSETVHRIDHDLPTRRSSTPWVVTGAIVGGVAGALWYVSGVRDDGDYLFPFTVIVTTGGSIGLGGAAGYLVEWMTR